MAIINTVAGNTVQNVQMLLNGSNYKAVNCSVISANVVPVTNNAIVRAIFPPPGGHGYNVASELGCNTACISITFQDTEGNTIPGNGEYR